MGTGTIHTLPNLIAPLTRPAASSCNNRAWVTPHLVAAWAAVMYSAAIGSRVPLIGLLTLPRLVACLGVVQVGVKWDSSRAYTAILNPSIATVGACPRNF
tara:strand:+ start:360 stop:659 length:300 start_codon:yes stop_codon:yes gene_type:complete